MFLKLLCITDSNFTKRTIFDLLLYVLISDKEETSIICVTDLMTLVKEEMLDWGITNLYFHADVSINWQELVP